MSAVVRVTARDLRTLVKETVPFACTDDDGLPVLSKVLLEARDGQLYGTATDRFRIVVSKVPQAVEKNEPGGELQVAVPVVALKRLTELFRPTRWSNPVLVLSVVGPDMRVRCKEPLAELSDVDVSVPGISPQGWPQVRNLLNTCLTTAERYERGSTVRAYNAEFLADFKVAVRERGEEPLEVVTPSGYSDPTVVLCGDHFVGLIMPRRLLGEVPEPLKPMAKWAEELAKLAPIPQGQPPRQLAKAGRS